MTITQTPLEGRWAFIVYKKYQYSLGYQQVNSGNTMPSHVYSLVDHEQKISGGPYLKNSLLKLIANHIKDRTRRKIVEEALLTHPYLDINEDPWVVQREKHIEQLLLLLREKLEKKEIIQIIPPEITGQGELTTDKFSNVHHVRCIDTPDGDLVLQFERHPYKNGQYLFQYWLYSSSENTLYLIPYTQKVERVKTEKSLVFKNRKWQSPSTDYQHGFETILEREIGHKAVIKFRRIVSHADQFRVLENLPEEVNIFCHNKLGTNINKIEELVRKNRLINNPSQKKEVQIHPGSIILEFGN